MKNKTKLIGIVVIFLIIASIFIIANLKPYPGLSIKDINDNPKNYDHQTVTIQAWYSPSYKSTNGEIYQKSYFSDKLEYLSINIPDDIDTSMLLGYREYIWTGIITTFAGAYGETYAQLNVTKTETLYPEDGRHNTSKFIGSWEQIEEKQNNKSYTENATWIFYRNNSFVGIYKDSNGAVYAEEWDRYVIDGQALYYCNMYTLDNKPACPAIYSFSENNTILTIEEPDRGNLTRVFQKINDTSRFIGSWKVEGAMGLSPDTSIYFTFYNNGTVEKIIENSTWMSYWVENNLLYMQENTSLPAMGFNYEFSNNYTHLLLTVSGYPYAELNKVE